MNLCKKLLSFCSRENFDREGGYREIWRIAYPLMIMGASYVILMISDRVLLSWHNSLEMAASVPAGGLSFTLFSFYTVTIGFTSALVAQYFGAGERDNCVRGVWNAFYLALMAGVCICCINIPLGRYFILVSGHKPEIIELELKFFYSIQPSAFFACINAAFFGFFSGTGRTKIIAKVNTTMCLINVVLDYMLIFGVETLNVPELGILGAGIATSICTGIGSVWVVSEFLRQDQAEYATRKLLQFDWSKVKKIVTFGMPSGLQVMLGSGGFTVFQFMIGYISLEAQTSASIFISLNNLAFAPIVGFCDATSILVGQYIGRNKKEVAGQVVYASWRMLVPYMAILAILYLGFPEFLVNFFKQFDSEAASKINFAEVTSLVSVMLIAATFSNVTDALRFVYLGALRGAGDTKAILYIIGGCSLLIFIPGSCILTRVCHVGIIGLWLFMVGYVTLLMVLLMIRFHSGKWREINLIHSK
ncbi:MAG: MATE family efflux transporter [Lentisphaeria bacterium]|nr:MATE family efflux transporter [Lentisphaeria bacterium]